MCAPWKRAAAIALATCGLSVVSFVGGCKTDVETTDAKVSTDNEKAVDALISFHPEAAREAATSATNTKGASLDEQIESNLLAAQADLDAASLLMSGPGPTNASVTAFQAVLDGKAQAGTSAGAGQTITPDRASLQGIDQRQLRVRELLSEMAAIAWQLQVNNNRVNGYKALEPTKAHEAYQSDANAAQKGKEGGAWFPGTAPIPSLDALQAREQELQKKIADLTAQRDDLNNKRGQALQEAGKFSQQADTSSGKDSVGFFTQAANQRKEAADDEVKAGQLDAQIAPLQQDLTLAQTQAKAVSDAIAGYGEVSQQLDSNWKNVQQRIDEATALTKSLLEGNGAAPAAPAPAAAPADAATAGGTAGAPAVSIQQTPTSLAGLATELDNQSKALQELRGKAVALLSSAMKHYDQAASTAATLNKSLSSLNGDAANAKLPDRRAWQGRMALFSPSSFKLAQAAVQNRFARLYTDEYAEVAYRNGVGASVADALKGSGGMTVPPSLAAALPPIGTVPVEIDTKLKEYAGDLKSDQPKYQADETELNELAGGGQVTPAGLQAIVAMQAEFGFKWAASLINEVINTPGTGESAALMTNIAHAALMATDYGNAQFDLLAGRQQEGDALMKAALAERGTLVDASAQNLIPGQLPPGLAFEPKPPPAPMPTAPTSAPATAPAAAPTTAPEGAAPPATAPAATQPADAAPPAAGTVPPTPAAGTTPPPTPGTTPPADGATPAPTTPGTTPPGTTPPPAPTPGATPAAAGGAAPAPETPAPAPGTPAPAPGTPAPAPGK